MPRNDYRVFPRFFSSIKNNKPITIFKKGKQTRTFCYVTDAITAMLMVIIKGKKFVYNIGNDKPEINMTKLYKLIKKNVPKKIKFININYPKNYPADEPIRRCPDINQSRKYLNFNPKISIETGIARMLKCNNLLIKK